MESMWDSRFLIVRNLIVVIMLSHIYSTFPEVSCKWNFRISLKEIPKVHDEFSLFFTEEKSILRILHAIGQKSDVTVYRAFLDTLKKDFIYLFFEIREGCEKERERNIDVGEKLRCERETSIGCLLRVPLTRNLVHNTGVCPYWELNQWPYAF